MKILFSVLRVATVTAFTSSSSRSSAHARQQVSSKMTATLSEPSTAIKFADESSNFKELISALEEITHLNHASAVLSYDRQ
ncbi:hypothetical protein THAOC_32219, partial [Thalassiosira oceanica]